MTGPLAACGVDTPLGRLVLHATDTALTALFWGGQETGRPNAVVHEAARQLAAYFDGTLTTFRVPVAPAGSDFERRVWSAMSAIPYGETRTYGALAAAIGEPLAARAVGAACGTNPLPIIVPCHRVTAAGGRSGGYSGRGGLQTKRFLLNLEGRVLLLT